MRRKTLAQIDDNEKRKTLAQQRLQGEENSSTQSVSGSSALPTMQCLSCKIDILRLVNKPRQTQKGIFTIAETNSQGQPHQDQSTSNS